MVFFSVWCLALWSLLCESLRHFLSQCRCSVWHKHLPLLAALSDIRPIAALCSRSLQNRPFVIAPSLLLLFLCLSTTDTIVHTITSHNTNYLPDLISSEWLCGTNASDSTFQHRHHSPQQLSRMGPRFIICINTSQCQIKTKTAVGATNTEAF